MGFCLTAIRIWQWSSSFFVYASFSLLYDHIQKNRLGENDRMRGVQVLVCSVPFLLCHVMSMAAVSVIPRTNSSWPTP